MISYAKLIALMNGDDDMIRPEYDNFMKIVLESWERFDDKQYFTKDLSEAEWQKLYSDAKKYSLWA